MSQTIFRKRISGRYFTMSKCIVDDERLSFKAKGIMAYLMSKPDDWDVRLIDVVNHASDGRDGVYSGIAELIDAGYMTREDVRDDGKFSGVIYTVYDEPQTEQPITEKPDTANPSPTKNKNTKNKKPTFAYDPDEDVRPTKKKKPLTSHQVMVGVLDEVCQEGIPLNAAHMNKLSSDLRKAGYEPDDIRRVFGEGGAWYSATYNGQQGKQPKLYDVRQQIEYLSSLKGETFEDKLKKAGYV